MSEREKISSLFAAAAAVAVAAGHIIIDGDTAMTGMRGDCLNQKRERVAVLLLLLF